MMKKMQNRRLDVENDGGGRIGVLRVSTPSLVVCALSKKGKSFIYSAVGTASPQYPECPQICSDSSS